MLQTRGWTADLWLVSGAALKKARIPSWTIVYSHYSCSGSSLALGVPLAWASHSVVDHDPATRHPGPALARSGTGSHALAALVKSHTAPEVLHETCAVLFPRGRTLGWVRPGPDGRIARWFRNPDSVIGGCLDNRQSISSAKPYCVHPLRQWGFRWGCHTHGYPPYTGPSHHQLGSLYILRAFPAPGHQR